MAPRRSVTLFFLILFLPSFLALPLHHLPAPSSSSSSSSSPSSAAPTWLAIERVPDGQGDAVLVRPEHCALHCAALLGAGAASIPRARCVCRCPAAEPVFVQSAEGGGKCAPRVPDCPGRTLRFDRPNDPDHSPALFAPTLSLPPHGDALASDLRIAWKENGVKVRHGQGPRCAIQSAYQLGSQPGWRPLDGDLFKLGWAGDDGRIIWTGNGKDAEELAGGIVQLVMECAAGKSGNGSFCVAFRTEGQIESQFALQGNGPSGAGDVLAGSGIELDRNRRAELVAIILLAVLLFLSLFGSIFLWNICWRMEKRKLIQSLQIQFLHYAKQEKDKVIADCQLRYQALVKAAAGVQQPHSPGPGSPQLGGIAMANGLFGAGGGDQLGLAGGTWGMAGMEGPPGAQQPRRKLYFSSEFFEPQLMSNPPPMAEQFLYDLRKMIAMARERIRIRRHVPRLHAIVESEDESVGWAAGSNSKEKEQSQKQQKLAREEEEGRKKMEMEGKRSEDDDGRMKMEGKISEDDDGRMKMEGKISEDDDGRMMKMEGYRMEVEDEGRKNKEDTRTEEGNGRMTREEKDGRMKVEGNRAEEEEQQDGKMMMMEEEERTDEKDDGSTKLEEKKAEEEDDDERIKMEGKREEEGRMKKMEELQSSSNMEIAEEDGRKKVEAQRKDEEGRMKMEGKLNIEKKTEDTKRDEEVEMKLEEKGRNGGMEPKYDEEEVNRNVIEEKKVGAEQGRREEELTHIEAVTEPDDDPDEWMNGVEEQLRKKMERDEMMMMNTEENEDGGEKDERTKMKGKECPKSTHEEENIILDTAKTAPEGTSIGIRQKGPKSTPGPAPTVSYRSQATNNQPQQPQQQPVTSRIPIGSASTSSKSTRNNNSSGNKFSSATTTTMTSSQQRSSALPPPLPPRPPPSPEPAADRNSSVPPSNRPPNGSCCGGGGTFSLSSMKRRANGAALSGGGDNIARAEGAPLAKGRPPSNLQSGSGIPCPVPVSSSSLLSSSYAVQPPSDHIKKSLPRRKKAIVPPSSGTTGIPVPGFAAVSNGGTTSSNLKMPTMV